MTYAELTARVAAAEANLLRAVEWITAWKLAREAEITRYRAALQPFADAYRRSLPPEYGGYGDTDPAVFLTLAQCQMAALALDLAKP